MKHRLRGPTCWMLLPGLACAASAGAQTVRYVDDDAAPGGDGLAWDTAYTHLQDALAEAGADATIAGIRVARGVYTPDLDEGGLVVPGDRTATFALIVDLSISGGYAGLAMPADPDARDVLAFESVLSGDLYGDDAPHWVGYDDNSYHVVTDGGTDPSAVLEGFTIRGGNADGSMFPNAYGGGLFVAEGACTVRDCTFAGNKGWYGGAVYTRIESAPAFVNCRFQGNQAEYGGGVRNYGASSPTFINCAWSGNSARLFGGAMSNGSDCAPVMVNGTLAGNTAGRGGGIHNALSAAPLLTNCLLWGNTAIGSTSEAAQIAGGLPVLDFCCVEGWSGALEGMGSFGANPGFVRYPDAGPDGAWDGQDDDFGDLHLGCASPCLDAGTGGTDPPLPATDLDGGPRVVDGQVDIGALEGPHQAVIVAGGPVLTVEGSTATFAVALACDPGGTMAVTVGPEVGDVDLSVQNGATLHFDSSDYTVPQSVTVLAADDDDLAEGAARFVVGGPGLTPAAVRVCEIENDVGPILFVNASGYRAGSGASWAEALTELSAALPMAAGAPVAVEQVWVAAGTYSPAAPDGEREATFRLHNGVQLYGGFAGTETDPSQRDPANPAYATILTGDLKGDDGDTVGLADNVYHVITAGFTDSSTLLDGFTIASGVADGLGSNAYGGGMYVEMGNPTVWNCVFEHNTADYGGNVHNRADGRPTFTDCRFEHGRSDRYGGGMYNYESSPTLTRCVFNANAATFRGGGLVNWSYADAVVTDCTFTDNAAQTGGGVYTYYFSGPTITHCVFAANQCVYAGAGLSEWHECASAISNCLFVGNVAWGSVGAGAGIYCSNSSPAITACALSGNYAFVAGGGIHLSGMGTQGPPPSVTDTILWGNLDSGGTAESAQVFVQNASPTVRFCSIQNLDALAGHSNQGDDPLFSRDADPGPDGDWGSPDDDLGDQHLACGSPCVDAGTNGTDPPLPATDLDGGPRIVDGTVDIGAFEGARPALSVSGGPLIIDEGGSAAFAVALRCDPHGLIDVEVAHDSGDADLYVASGATLAFDSSNYEIPQTVVIAAAEDVDLFPGQAVFKISAPDTPFVTLAAHEVENDISPILHVDADALETGDGSDWPNAMPDLHLALSVAAASPGAVSEVWVAEGRYTPAPPDGDRRATFQLVNGVGVYGGFTGLETQRDERHPTLFEHTVLSGDLNGDDQPGFFHADDNSFHVVTGSGTDASAVLDGFAITGGRSIPLTDDENGAGMCNEYASPTVANCAFRGGQAKWGAGMYNLGSAPTVTDCTFGGNVAWLGGAVFNDQSSPTITGCGFLKNQTMFDGGAVYNWESADPLLTACTFEANSAEWGGAMANQVGCFPVMVDCVFAGNVADMGGAVINFGTAPTIVGCRFERNAVYGGGGWPGVGGAVYDVEGGTALLDCVFTENTAKDGGGALYTEYTSTAVALGCVFVDNQTDGLGGAMLNTVSSVASLINCTVVGNTARGLCGGVFNSGSAAPAVTNCILWNNSGPASLTRTGGSGPNPGGLYEHDQIQGGTPIVSYTCIEGLDTLTGNGNIGSYPRFQADGIHIQQRSRCRNAGDPEFSPGAEQTDLDGEPRVMDGRVDMGADEVRLELETPVTSGSVP